MDLAPFTISPSEMDEMMDRVDRALQEWEEAMARLVSLPTGALGLATGEGAARIVEPCCAFTADRATADAHVRSAQTIAANCEAATGSKDTALSHNSVEAAPRGLPCAPQPFGRAPPPFSQVRPVLDTPTEIQQAPDQNVELREAAWRQAIQEPAVFADKGLDEVILPQARHRRGPSTSVRGGS